MSVSEEQVFAALRECYDPEIPLNLVDLGLIYDVRISSPEGDEQEVEVDMTLTSPGCPSHVFLGEQIKSKVGALPGVKEARVNVVWSPPWGPERISPEGRQKLGIE